MKQKLLLFFLSFTFFINAQEAYYDGIDFSLNGLELKAVLANHITSTQVRELIYTPEVWEASKITDVNPDNSSQVLLIYGYSASGISSRTRGINNNGGNSGEWNREHVFPRSLGRPNLGFEGAGSDAHNLRPADVDYNSNRSNLRFKEGSGTSGVVTGGWYPGDEWKGDVARMMMYMYLRYGDQCLPTDVGVGDKSNTPDEMIDLFLEWNVEDPVSDFERQRNSYHGDASNTYAQGNRNPFIDNAYLATKIWGGEPAEDTWGIFTSDDTIAPSAPTAVLAQNITTTSFDIHWTASTDNEGISGYEVYLNSIYKGFTNETIFTATDLIPNTNYNIIIIAKDNAGNTSEGSDPIIATTLEDLSAPTPPTNVSASIVTKNSFQLSWTAATDDSGILTYDIYLNDNFYANTTDVVYNVTGLEASTTYTVKISAEDIVNNTSDFSNPINVTTTDGSNDITELFFSEYVEGSGYNKALEIVNLTSGNIDLSPYSIRRQSLGNWEAALQLSGIIAINDVYVLTNTRADLPELVAESDFNTEDTPMVFNGDDRVGLFKNGELIDIIGDLDGTSEFAKDVTLRRNPDITAPSTDYSEQREWTAYAQNTVDNIGVFNSVLSQPDDKLETFSLYPNPNFGSQLFFSSDRDVSISIFNVLGKKIIDFSFSSGKSSLDISELPSGMYLIKVKSETVVLTKKLIKK